MNWVLYGATGYTGELLVAEAVARGLKPLLAGRSAAKLEPLARKYDLPWQAFSLDEAQVLRAVLKTHPLVLHVAGPFVKTSAPMVEACLEVGAHYLDITGELPVFEAIFARDAEARARGVALIPGVGFDVVPTDCLAAWLVAQVKQPVSLEIDLVMGGRASPGTAKSALGLLPLGARVRRGGVLERWPMGKGVKTVRFPSRSRLVVPGPLADLTTAFHATGVPDITVSMAMPRRAAQAMQWTWPLWPLTGPLLGLALETDWVRGRLDRWLERTNPGSTAQQRETGRSELHALVRDAQGQAHEAWMTTPDGYAFTQQSAIRAVERVLRGGLSGALAPSTAFGADFVMELTGVERFTQLPPA